MTAEEQNGAAKPAVAEPSVDTSHESLKDTEKQEVKVDHDAEFIQTGTQSTTVYLQGLQLHLLTFGLCLSILLVNFEIAVVSTSLVSITDDLQQFSRSSWVITAYLLTYTAFMVILAKLSDIIGRKTVLIASLLVFILFSGVCGAAQTMVQLIVFRAFQGLGGSGVYSLVMVILFEMVPPPKIPAYSVLVTSLFAISLLCGPLVGGAITVNTTWRWVFLVNVPAGFVALLPLIIYMPNNFPNHGQPAQPKKSTIGGFGKLDLIGAGAMLVGIVLLIVGFEEASTFAPWKSARVLAPLLVSLVAWVFFFWFERRVTLKDNNKPEPVFPWRFCSSRVILGIFINAFLAGAVFTSCVIQIPLRFQAVNNLSPWLAGVRLIPFAVATPVGATLNAALCGKFKMPIVWMVFPGAIFQILGLVFLSRMTLDDISWNGQYGLQFLAGLGCGLSMGVSTLMTPYVIKKRDIATATSAVVQIRVIGGALILAIVIAVMNSNLKSTLLHIISPEQFELIFQRVSYIYEIAEPMRTSVRDSFMKGFDVQLRILIGFAAAGIPTAGLMWQKEQVRIK